jgi:molecular chaperone DnaJ
MKDYYEILGVNKTATQDEIKKAYRNLSKKYHPDRNPDNPEAEEKFREISEAYETLGNEEKRADYDNPPTMFDPFGLHNRPSKPTVKVTLNCTLEDLYNKVTKEVQYSIGKDKCKHCNGTGMERSQTKTPFGIAITETTCKHCHGTGRCGESEIRTISVVLDPLNLQNAYSTPDCNILIDFNILPHKDFENSLFNLIYTLDITIPDLVLGTSAEIPTLKGTKLKINIPAGTSPDKKFRIANHGLVSGADLYIKLNLVMPTKLSKKERELYIKLKECQKK